jgi:hypothetical protein
VLRDLAMAEDLVSVLLITAFVHAINE